MAMDSGWPYRLGQGQTSSGFVLGWCQDNGNRSNQESKFDFLATRQRLVKIDEGQQKIKIVCTNQQSNLRGLCQSLFSLCQHHPKLREGSHDFGNHHYFLTHCGHFLGVVLRAI